MTRPQEEGGGGRGERVVPRGVVVPRVMATTKPQRKKVNWRQQVWLSEMSRNRGPSEHRQSVLHCSIHMELTRSLSIHLFIECMHVVTS